MTETRYAKTTDGLRIAYRILGEGPVDLVFVISSWWSNFEAALEWDFSARLLRGLAARSRGPAVAASPNEGSGAARQDR